MTDNAPPTPTGRSRSQTWFACAKDTLVGASLTALLGPPLSGLLVLAVAALVSDESIDPSPGSVAGLVLAGVSAGYLLAGLPTFIAGLALAAVGRIATPAVAVCTVGVLCVTIYFATLGAHLLPRAWADHLVLLTGLSAFIGTSVAARVALAALGSRRL